MAGVAGRSGGHNKLAPPRRASRSRHVPDRAGTSRCRRLRSLAVCQIWTHPSGGEARLTVDGSGTGEKPAETGWCWWSWRSVQRTVQRGGRMARNRKSPKRTHRYGCGPHQVACRNRRYFFALIPRRRGQRTRRRALPSRTTRPRLQRFASHVDRRAECQGQRQSSGARLQRSAIGRAPLSGRNATPQQLSMS